jgi:hypothetical protein
MKEQLRYEKMCKLPDYLNIIFALRVDAFLPWVSLKESGCLNFGMHHLIKNGYPCHHLKNWPFDGVACVGSWALSTRFDVLAIFPGLPHCVGLVRG